MDWSSGQGGPPSHHKLPTERENLKDYPVGVSSGTDALNSEPSLILILVLECNLQFTALAI
jgi:hypothetical protein